MTNDIDPSSGRVIRHLEWDSSHFGLRIGRAVSSTPDSLPEAAAVADRDGFDCVYLLLDAGDADAVRLAAEHGWRMVDVRVTLAMPVQQTADAAASIRTATAADLPRLRQIAAESHRASRFFADGRFPESACASLFVRWIERSLASVDRGDAVFVAEDDAGLAQGYLTASAHGGEGEIGLVAVAAETRGSGLGTALLTRSAAWFAAAGARRVSVVTQGGNRHALRLYQRRGFHVERLELWFHRWR